MRRLLLFSLLMTASLPVLAQTEIANTPPVSGPPPVPAPPESSTSAAPPAIPVIPQGSAPPAPPENLPGINAPEAVSLASATQPGAPLGYRSLLYTPEDMQKIYGAEQIYRVNLEKARELARLKGLKVTPAVLAQMQKPEEQSRTVEHPQFFLSLLAFRTEKDWSLKVNGAEYTAENPTVGSLTVISANKTNARFSWKPQVFPIYSDRTSPDVTKNIVWLNQDDQRVEFTLAVNQSFSAYSMRVVEGYLPPVKLEQFITAVSVNAETSVQVKEPNQQ